MTKNFNPEDKIFYFPNALDPVTFVSIFKTMTKHYPNCFSMSELKILKKGILKDLIADKSTHGIGNNGIRRFLAQYTNTIEYVNAHIQGANRYDLQGNTTDDTVTAEEVVLKLKSNKTYVKLRIKNKPNNRTVKP